MHSTIQRVNTKQTTIHEQLQDIFGREFRQSMPDWKLAVAHLLVMAEEANKTFQFEKAVGYLDTITQMKSAGIVNNFTNEIKLKMHREKGKALSFLARYDEAIAEFKKILALDTGQNQNNSEVRSEVFTQIGQILAKQGDHERALGYLQRAIGGYRRGNDKTGLSKALRNLGVVYVELGDFDEAEICFTEAIAIATTLSEDLLYADLINNLGAIMNMKGNWTRALELYKESLRIYQDKNEIRKEAYAKNNIGITLNEREKSDEAFSYFVQAFEIASAINDPSLKLIVDINLADLYLKRGSIANAREHLFEAQKFLAKSKLVNAHLVETKILVGKIFCTENKYSNAKKALSEALKLSREIGSKFHEAEALLERGKLQSSSHNHFEALNDLESSYKIYNSIKADGRKEITEKVIGSIEHLYLEIFNSIGKQVDRKDSYTKGHSDRVASLALLLAKEMKLNTHMLKTIVAAGLLHDIGKIKIADHILNKPGKLTDAEFAEIKKHPEYGVEQICTMNFPWDIKPLILHHHERYDGSGYPHRIKGEDIPLGARILCVADVFEALTSNRTYRGAYSTAEALKIMKSESGSTFDPVVFSKFAQIAKRGEIDCIVNSQTRHDEMYLIWSQCMADGDKESDPARDFAAS